MNAVLADGKRSGWTTPLPAPEADRAVLSRRGERPPVRGKRQRPDALGVPLQDRQRPASVYGPQVDRLVRPRRGQDRAVRREGYAVHGLVGGGDGGYLTPRLDIPQPDRMVVASRGQEVLFWSERQGGHLGGV